MAEQTVRLTQTVKKGGCAAKLPAGELKKVLSGLKLNRPVELIVGSETMDDASLWDLGNGEFLVQTLDFFTPIVDDPYDFGAIAATNALSDIYAMGGVPKTALTILGFPTQTLDLEILKPMLQGAIDQIHLAGACLAGGHTIDDETLKLGFSVSGFVKKGKEWTNAASKVGDVLILTKGLGTGTITSALKSGDSKPEWVSAAVASMKTLNQTDDLLGKVTVNAATDVTGFGFSGHALQMAQASDVQFIVDLEKLPEIQGAIQSISADNLNRAHSTNRQYAEPFVEWRTDQSSLIWLTVDPQTSGGLLLSVPATEANAAITCLRTRFPETVIVGKVVKKETSARFVIFQ